MEIDTTRRRIQAYYERYGIKDLTAIIRQLREIVSEADTLTSPGNSNYLSYPDLQILFESDETKELSNAVELIEQYKSVFETMYDLISQVEKTLTETVALYGHDSSRGEEWAKELSALKEEYESLLLDKNWEAAAQQMKTKFDDFHGKVLESLV